MNNLKYSIAFLFFYLSVIFGLAEVRFIEDNVINFDPIFFVLILLAVVSGIFASAFSRSSIYLFLFGWSVLYVMIWVFFWRFKATPLSLQVLGIQFLLVEISAGLAFDVGRQIALMNELFEGLSASAYPNRTLEFHLAEDRIGAELTRSRRYHHALSLLIVELEKSEPHQDKTRFAGLQKDLLQRLAVAKVGQIISERARETDLIIRDRSGRFLVLCPETDYENSAVFARRINQAVAESMGAGIVWSSASFPDEALTFEDLLERAERRLATDGILPVSSDVSMHTD